jgi:hypothetical protein
MLLRLVGELEHLAALEAGVLKVVGVSLRFHLKRAKEFAM